MSYDILISEKAKKQLSKLDRGLRERIIKTLKRCRVRPYVHVKKLVSSPYFRLRVGDYRVIMDIKDNELRILVIEIDHRKKIYKK
jgi:mRNA interferase RelE/StbE